MDEIPIKIVIDSLKYCIDHKNLRINAYVIMPSHLHAIVFDAKFDSVNLSKTLTAFRKFTGKQLSDYVDAKCSSAFSDVLRDRNLKDRERRFWQPGWHAEGIYSDKFWEQKVNYLHSNPCRKGLVLSPELWQFSSASFWLGGKATDLPISSVAWEV